MHNFVTVGKVNESQKVDGWSKMQLYIIIVPEGAMKHSNNFQTARNQQA